MKFEISFAPLLLFTKGKRHFLNIYLDRCPTPSLILLARRQDQDVISLATIPGNRIASGSTSGMIFVHSIESSVLIMKWHIDDCIFGYGEGIRTESRSEAQLSPKQLQKLRPQDYTINRSKILADKVSLTNLKYFYSLNLCIFR